MVYWPRRHCSVTVSKQATPVFANSKGEPMRLGKFNYYSDFVIYPLAIAALIAVDVSHGTRAGQEPLYALPLACLSGLSIWSLLEYVLHRVALHLMPYFSAMHRVHHAEPLAFIGTPAWISIAVWLATILLPLSFVLGFSVADGVTVGVMLGYWWYGIVHHVIHHHAHSRRSAFFDRLRAWHMRHHHSPKRGNFGVTTALWDRVFGTAIGARERRS
jgi:sterol desaturase/sphingolipid hydroxylase (fatty acid hydroxylase superfamily)